MKSITIGDTPLMQMPKEDVLEIAVRQGVCVHLEYWNYPEIIDYNNTKFSNTIVIRFQQTRREDNIESDVIVFFFDTEELSFHYYRSNPKNSFPSRRFNIDIIKLLIQKGYDVPIY